MPATEDAVAGTVRSGNVQFKVEEEWSDSDFELSD
jgi:citrate lyase gamma subunit